MARIPLTSGFQLVPEGTYIFRIYAVNYDEDFGKIDIKMVNAQGQTHLEKFSIMDADGSYNEKALGAFSIFAKVALNDMDAEDVDPAELVDHYIEASIIHNQSESKKNPGKMNIFANLGREKNPADGFVGEVAERAMTLGHEGETAASTTQPKVEPKKSLADLLG